MKYNKDADRDTNVLIYGIEPLVAENRKRIGVWAVGSKSGFNIFNENEIKVINEFIRRGGRILFNCMSGGVVNEHLFKENFHAYMLLDIDISKFNADRQRILYMNHSMMVRSMPEEDEFFYEPIFKEKEFDYSITTWAFDNTYKRFDRAIKIIDLLARAGFKGQLFLSRLEQIPPLPPVLGYWQSTGRLKIYSKLPPRDYHREQARAKFGIFPNTIDAFPKACIENILTDKYVVVSHDLLIGKSTITPEIGQIIDFDSPTWESQLLEVMKKEVKTSPRAAWLKKYNFEEVSKIWAREINKLLGTNYQQVFYEYHLERVPRIDKYYEYIKNAKAFQK